MENYVKDEDYRNFLTEVLKEDREETVTVLPKTLVPKVMTEKRLELLETLRHETIVGIRDLARTLGRDPSVVKKDLDFLWQHGLIKYTEEGRRKIPERTSQKIVVQPL